MKKVEYSFALISFHAEVKDLVYVHVVERLFCLIQ